jgi:D-3-phosphoglycerate dehydrogenase
MQKGAFLVNTARGGIVDEAALYEYLTNGHLAGAAFDVFEEEPLNNQKLIELENFVSTPHIAGSANESVLAMGMAAIQGLERGKKALRENFFNY